MDEVNEKPIVDDNDPGTSTNIYELREDEHVVLEDDEDDVFGELTDEHEFLETMGLL